VQNVRAAYDVTRFDSAIRLRQVPAVPSLAEAPQSVRTLLWDVDLESIDLQRDHAYVCERVMARGGLAAMRWLIRTYEQDTLRAIVASPAGARLAPRERAFWRLATGLPPLDERGGGRASWAT